MLRTIGSPCPLCDGPWAHRERVCKEGAFAYERVVVDGDAELAVRRAPPVRVAEMGRREALLRRIGGAALEAALRRGMGPGCA